MTEDGLGVVERGWGVQAQVHGLGLREADGRDVLVLRGVQVAHDADEVDDGADVGGVCAGTEGLGIAGLLDEVGAGAVGEGVDDGLAVAVIEDDLCAGLGEAGELGVDGTLEAVCVGLEGEGAGEEIGVLLESLGVRGWDAADGGEVLFNASLLEAGLDEVLRGAYEGSGTALRTADLRVEKSPPVSGAMNMTACWASAGTVTKVPSSRILGSQVSMR